jgi:N-acyl-D-aspartate/D-glutamate deacylase
MTYDLLVKGGTIIDGTGVPRFIGDIGVRHGVIAQVGRALPDDNAKHVIDATGRIVAPGVIDPHTHYDAQVHWDPYCTNSGWHGNTTVAVGNCGFGFMPCRASDRDRYMLMMENTEQIPLEAMRTALPWSWETFPEWMAHMRRLNKGINLAAYMPINSLMIYVMGYEAAKTRGATAEERRQMRDLLHEAMDAGAIGFGLSYLREFNSHKDIDGSPMPTDVMCLDDLYYLAEVLRERDEGIIQILCELPPAKISYRQVSERLAEISRRPVLFNIIGTRDLVPEYHLEVMGWLDAMEARGLDIYAQAFIARSWTEFTAIDYDQWNNISPRLTAFSVSSVQEKVALARDSEFITHVESKIDPRYWSGGTPATFRLLDAKGAHAYAADVGRLIGEIAADRGGSSVKVFFDIVAESDCMAEFRSTHTNSGNASYAAEALRHKRVIPGNSDGGAHVKFFAGGQWATDNLIWLVREEGLITLEEMHYKLSYLPARALGLERRGALLAGYAADLYVYDYDKLGFDRNRYLTVHDLPGGDWRRTARAEGIEWIVVNGSPIFHNGAETNAMPGRMLSAGGIAKDEVLDRTTAIAAE